MFSTIEHYVWWIQLLIGVGLAAAGAVIEVAGQKNDIGFLDIVGFVVGIAGLCVIFNLL